MSGKLAIGAGLLVVLLAGSSGARAQVQSVDTSQPIVIKQLKPPAPKRVKFLGQFVSSTNDAVTVRDRNNTYALRTFSFGPGVGPHMQQIAARGGYKYGDKVEIDYAAGSDVALEIKGKPSSPKVD